MFCQITGLSSLKNDSAFNNLKQFGGYLMAVVEEQQKIWFKRFVTN